MPIQRSMCAVGALVSAFAIADVRPVIAQPGGTEQLPQVTVEATRVKRKPKPKPVADNQKPLPRVVIQTGSAKQPGPPPIKQRYDLPQTAESQTADRVRETVNAVDPQDTVKYMPSLFVRKRNFGDNQSVLATRTTGLGASARSLIYVDDILVSSLIANNNTLGVSQWGLITPEAISRVDFLYGPFSAAYPGNSEGGVLLFTTKMPEKFEFTTKQTEAIQTFDVYKTKGAYGSHQTSLSVGDKIDRFSYFIGANYLNSDSQPLGWVTSTTTPAGTTGTIPQSGRVPGTVANVVGASGLLHSEQETLNGKFAYELTPWVTATYTIGLWNNNQISNVQSYLQTTATGAPTYGGVSGFANGRFTWDQTRLANAVSLKSDTKGTYDFDIAVSYVDFLNDTQRLPFGVGAGLTFTPFGKIARLDGTNWTNGDAKGIWRASDFHEVSFGVHGDRYYLFNPVYKTADWVGGPDSTNTLYTSSAGTTRTLGLWVQDAWKFAPNWKLTTGVRLEDWAAYNGFNLQTTTTAATGAITNTVAMYQPSLGAQRVSPKVSLAYEPNPDWLVTASFGAASRFPTVAELYQIVSVSSTVLAVPNPNLKPEDVLSEEIAFERRFTDGKVRLSFFFEDGRNTLISQLAPTTDSSGNAATASFIQNIDRTRTRGVELAAQKNNVLIDRMEVFGSVTYTDARIVSDPNFVSTVGGTTANGKYIPNIPPWRVTAGATYRLDENWSLTAAMRYASKQYSTLDNTDTVANVYQAFDSYTVVDLRVQRKATDNATVSFGIDNVGNAKYHLFHPFPQRTYVADVRLKF
ncbi:MAG: TonB-dependent receptor [Afipia sp.]|nr:TonB-dependent receptor [Afipia sp.]